jgi:hypothetical protein
MPPSASTQSADTSPADARSRLLRLQAERLEAADAGLDPASRYRRHLDAAIADARTGYVTAAVTEIAALRAALGAALQG